MRILVPSIDAAADSPYLFRELFAYAAAPVVTGTKCKPGPGEWISDAGTTVFAANGPGLFASKSVDGGTAAAEKISLKDPLARFHGMAMRVRATGLAPAGGTLSAYIGFGHWPADSDNWSHMHEDAGPCYVLHVYSNPSETNFVCDRGWNFVPGYAADGAPPAGDSPVAMPYVQGQQEDVLIVLNGTVAGGDAAGGCVLIRRGDGKYHLVYYPWFHNYGPPYYYDKDETWPFIMVHGVNTGDDIATVAELAVYAQPFLLTCYGNDSFNRDTAATLGSLDGLAPTMKCHGQTPALPWQATRGSWGIAAGSGRNAAALLSDGTPAGKPVMATVDPGIADLYLRADATDNRTGSSQGTRAGVCFRLSDADNFWCAYFKKSTPRYARLSEANAGVEVVRATTLTATTYAENMHVVTHGSKICYMGSYVIQNTLYYESSFNQTATRCGLLTFYGDAATNTRCGWTQFGLMKSAYDPPTG